jgi:L-alanine-DL-glutamate epimerase-like enolase superfamily enzyme
VFTIEARQLAHPLAVSHTTVTHVSVATARLVVDGHTGRGEVAVGPWTEEQPTVVVRQAQAIVRALDGTRYDVDDVESALDGASPSSRMLAEMALLDLLASQEDVPLWQLLDLPRPQPVRLWRTVSLGEPLPRRGRLKVKLGGPQDVAVLSALARFDPSDTEVVVDVNRGWTKRDWAAVAEPLTRVTALVALEDPVADRDLLPEVRDALPGIPVLLDESVHTVADIEQAAQCADGANVKLLKSGGLLAARACLDRLAGLGGLAMLGCFVEPARSIAYAAQLTGLVQWADLDGHLVLDGGEPGGELALDLRATAIPGLVHRYC